MLNDSMELSTVLRNLTRNCSHAEANLILAQQLFRSGFLGTLLQHFAKQRARHRGELLSELRRQGPMDDPDGISDDSFEASPAFRMRSSFDGRADADLARLCQEESAALIESYKEALKAPFPGSTLSMLHRHFTQSQDMHEALKVLSQME